MREQSAARPVTRRAAIGMLGIGIAGAPALLRARWRVFAGSQSTYSERAIRLMRENLVVDLLNQFRFPDYAEKPPRSDRWLHEPGSLTAADADLYLGSGMTALALGDGARDYDDAIRFFADWNGFLAGYDDWFMRVDDGRDFARAKQAKKLGVMLTFQNSNHFRRADDVNTFWGLGQRLSQLTYNFDNGIGSGFLEARDGGLTVFGHSIVERMNGVGMAVDVSHCADLTTMDALAASKAPVVFTHAGCRALMPGHLRCKTDEAIRAMAKTGGVMGINTIRFMVRDREPVTIEHVIDHIDHVVKLVGVQHVAIGSDVDMIGNPNPMHGGGDPRTQPNFSRYQYHEGDGGRITIEGLDHPKRMYDMTDALIRRGYNDQDIGLILGGNAVRVLSAIWSSPAKPAGRG